MHRNSDDWDYVHPRGRTSVPSSPQCPSEPELLRDILSGDRRSEDALERHARQCASCRTLRAELAEVVSGLHASTETARSGSGDCLDEAALAEFVERRDEP